MVCGEFSGKPAWWGVISGRVITRACSKPDINNPGISENFDFSFVTLLVRFSVYIV